MVALAISPPRFQKSLVSGNFDMKQWRQPTLDVWGDNDLAVGKTAAVETAKYVTGPYHFERLRGASHWLQQEASDRIVALLLAHFGVGPRKGW